MLMIAYITHFTVSMAEWFSRVSRVKEVWSLKPGLTKSVAVFQDAEGLPTLQHLHTQVAVLSWFLCSRDSLAYNSLHGVLRLSRTKSYFSQQKIFVELLNNANYFT